jgi:hypothetical protein
MQQRPQVQQIAIVVQESTLGGDIELIQGALQLVSELNRQGRQDGFGLGLGTDQGADAAGMVKHWNAGRVR